MIDEAPRSFAALAVYQKSTRELVMLAPAGFDPDASMAVVPIPTGYAEGTFVWDKTTLTFVESVSKVRAQLLAAVKVEAEGRKMGMLSSGGAKKSEYAEKRAEVTAWDSLGGTVSAILLAFNALPAAIKATRFAYAIADAAAFGDQPADAIARFKAGIMGSANVMKVAAAEAKGCAAIKAATTAASARAAYAAAMATWPTTT